jgi:DNA-3-methyladenine glycosylase
VTGADIGDVRRLLTASPEHVAPILLGAHVVSEIDASLVVVRLSEVEAYGGIGVDPGSHAYRRRTRRNSSMFAAPGHAYAYFVYGMHWCLNVVAHVPGESGAILLRAGEVVEGAATAHARRASVMPSRDLARGPARLAQSLGVDASVDGVDLLDEAAPIRLLLADQPHPGTVAAGPRTGVSGPGSSRPWRFWIEGDPSVSRYRPGRNGG